jgi:RNA polymerase sigma factor (sigma-70 family)
MVRSFTPYMWAIARSHRLGADDCEDVLQAAWGRISRSLHQVRDLERLGDWIGTTTRNEALRLLKARKRYVPVGDGAVLDAADPLQVGVDDQVADRPQTDAVLEAFRRLPERSQRLLAALIEEPPPSYAEISVRLGMPRGSIGPTRATSAVIARGPVVT